MIQIKARYQGTAAKPIRAKKEMLIPCARDKNIIHKYTKDEVIGVEPTNHHYVFGRPGDRISGGFYIRVGTETPDFIELHAEGGMVKLEDLSLILELP